MDLSFVELSDPIAIENARYRKREFEKLVEDYEAAGWFARWKMRLTCNPAEVRRIAAQPLEDHYAFVKRHWRNRG